MATTIRRVDPAENEFLASLESKSKQPNPFLRAMANRPDALKNFVPFYASLVGPGSVDRRTKVMAYLVTSYANRCAFCIAANLPGGRKAGLTEDELRNLETGQDETFNPAERAVIRYARDFTQEQIVEITLVIAMANFTNRFNNGLEILPEA
jgi:AhpD family alkylhydroperoxidase